MEKLLTHLLKANHAAKPPYADFTLCGIECVDVGAMWPGEALPKPDSFGRYVWCQECKALEKSALNGGSR